MEVVGEHGGLGGGGGLTYRTLRVMDMVTKLGIGKLEAHGMSGIRSSHEKTIFKLLDPF